MNPYEVTPMVASAEQSAVVLPPARWYRLNGLVVGAGLIGYFAPIVVLGLLSRFAYGWPAAMDNLERVARMHFRMDVNFAAAFAPNFVLALIVTVATSKWVRSDGTQRQWWIVGGIILMSHVVVSFATAHWNLIPWTWSSELSNAIRSALTLIIPFVAHVTMSVHSRRTNACTGVGTNELSNQCQLPPQGYA